jgi:hypothetical protein
MSHRLNWRFLLGEVFASSFAACQPHESAV